MRVGAFDFTEGNLTLPAQRKRLYESDVAAAIIENNACKQPQRHHFYRDHLNSLAPLIPEMHFEKRGKRLQGYHYKIARANPFTYCTPGCIYQKRINVLLSNLKSGRRMRNNLCCSVTSGPPTSEKETRPKFL